MDSLLSFFDNKKKILGIVGIASAIDFTLKLIKNLTNLEYKKYINKKEIRISSKYSESPYIFTSKFIKDSKKFFIADKKNIKIKKKTILLYGLQDTSVSLESQVQLLKRISHSETTLIISKKSDHRMSSDYDLKILKNAILSMF